MGMVWAPLATVSPALLRFKAPRSLHRSSAVRLRRDSTIKSQKTNQADQQQQLNLSVLRFTLGIPGLDESYLPGWIGVACGGLILLNHFFSTPSSMISAQIRSEILGICLAAFSTALPYLGKFFQNESQIDRSILPKGNAQIFVMSEDLSDMQKEELAWGSYVLLRNTNTMSVLIAFGESLCIRGYWNFPEDLSKAQLQDWFKSSIRRTGFLDLKETLYFPQQIDTETLEMLPNGTVSFLVEPVYTTSDLGAAMRSTDPGIVLVVSNVAYAYCDRDRSWIKAVAKKFCGTF